VWSRASSVRPRDAHAECCFVGLLSADYVTYSIPFHGHHGSQFTAVSLTKRHTDVLYSKFLFVQKTLGMFCGTFFPKALNHSSKDTASHPIRHSVACHNTPSHPIRRSVTSHKTASHSIRRSFTYHKTVSHPIRRSVTCHKIASHSIGQNSYENFL
jgi:hypothetical protein